MDNGERDGPKCACTPEWPCMWHGTEGRDADVADVPEAVLRVQYQTEDRFAELSPGVPWTPPVELRPADRVPEQGARPAAVAEVLELGEQFDAIDKYKDQTTKVRYVVVTTWTGCGVTEREVFTYRKRAEKEVVRLQKVTRHRSRSKALRDKPYHEDTAVVTVEPQVVPIEFYGANGHRRSCACGCGEEFVVMNERQQFVNVAHKQRAWRRSKDVTVDSVTV